MLIKAVREGLHDIWYHLFAYGYPGCGKTKLGGDFHLAGQSLVVVTGEAGTLTLDAMAGVECPVLVPQNEAEIRAIIEHPDAITERVIREMDGFADYEPRTWMFDNLRGLQARIFGEGPQPRKELFGGRVEIEAKPATGIMAEPNKRDSAGVPANKDYRLLDMRMRGIVAGIEAMNCHTIVTAHAEKDLGVETRLQFTGDPKKDKEVKRVYTGYPSLEGFALKYDLPGLVSDFYLYLESPNQVDYYMYPKPERDFYARTRLSPFMPPMIEWTGKNGYTLLQNYYEKAKEKQKK